MISLRDSGQRVRAPVIGGSYGSQVFDWPNAVLSNPIPCELQPLSSDEQIDDQQRVEGRWTLFLPADADLLATDRWKQAGVTYEVDGIPKVWRHNGAIHHIEARVKRFEGA